MVLFYYYFLGGNTEAGKNKMIFLWFEWEIEAQNSIFNSYKLILV